MIIPTLQKNTITEMIYLTLYKMFSYSHYIYNSYFHTSIIRSQCIDILIYTHIYVNYNLAFFVFYSKKYVKQSLALPRIKIIGGI